jgi:hypothetical protein
MNAPLVVIRNLNRGFICVMLSVIFYGAFRKWVFPGLSSVIYFAPDVIIAWVYYYAFKHKLYPMLSLDKLFYFIFFLLLIVATIQAYLLDNLIIPLFGFRNYCFILPLVVLIYTYLTEEYLKKIALYFCIIAVPTAILVYVQSVSSVDSFINRSVGEGTNQKIFVVVDGVARTTGFFSFNTGHSLFTFTAMGLFVYLVFSGKSILKTWSILIISISLIICVVVSGSRSNYFVSGAGLLVFVLSQLTTLKYRKSFMSITLSIFILIAGYFFATYFLKNNIDNINRRFETADNVSDRLFGQLKLEGFTQPLTHNLPVLGYGIGIASPGATAGLGQALPIKFGYEVEWARFFVEVGVFVGLLLIFFRIFLTYYMIRDSIHAFILSQNPGTLVLCSMFFFSLMIGQVSMNALTMYFTWFVFALCVAICRLEKQNRQV